MTWINAFEFALTMISNILTKISWIISSNETFDLNLSSSTIHKWTTVSNALIKLSCVKSIFFSKTTILLSNDDLSWFMQSIIFETYVSSLILLMTTTNSSFRFRFSLNVSTIIKLFVALIKKMNIKSSSQLRIIKNSTIIKRQTC